MPRVVFGSELANIIVQNEPELLPCPFCGGRPTFVEPDRGGWEYQIICTDCQVYPESGDRAEVIRHWNTRWEET